MSNDRIEERLATIERTLAEVNQKLTALVGGPSPTSRWWENLPPPMTDDQLRENEAEAPYREYIRMTGDCPPKSWRPGDPIPEPDYWK